MQERGPGPAGVSSASVQGSASGRPRPGDADLSDHEQQDDQAEDAGPSGDPGGSPGPDEQDRRPRWWLLAGVAAAILVADQLTKWWAVAALEPFDPVHVVWTLQLQLVHNTGAAFSFSQGQGVWISVLALVAVAVLLRTGRQARGPVQALALGLIVGGALGNLSDRAFRSGDGFLRGGVVDFIDLQWWPVFNVADMGVVTGAALLIWIGARQDRLERRARAGSPDPQDLQDQPDE